MQVSSTPTTGRLDSLGMNGARGFARGFGSGLFSGRHSLSLNRAAASGSCQLIASATRSRKHRSARRAQSESRLISASFRCMP